MDNNDQSKGWGFMYSMNDKDIYNEIMQAIVEGSIKGGIESVSGWEEWFKEKGHIYERIFSDEELAAMVNGKEIRNDTGFAVRSVGVKAIKATMNERMTNLEIYDPEYK